MLNWIILNWTVFDIETVLTLNWIVIYNCLNSLKWKCFWQLNCVLMLNWIILNRTDYLHKMGLALNNIQRLICHKTQQTNQHLLILYFLLDRTPNIELKFRPQKVAREASIHCSWNNFLHFVTVCPSQSSLVFRLDSYNTVFDIEMLFNTSINLSFAKSIYLSSF